MTGAPSSPIFTPSRLFLAGGLVTLVVALALVVPTLPSIHQDAGQTPVAGPNVGSIAPDFELYDASSGQPVGLSMLRGKPVWLNFWASWCQSCKDEMPIIEKVYEKYQGSGLQVVDIDVQESADTVRNFVSSNRFRWTFLLDADGRITDRYFVNGVPYHVFIGSDGVIKGIRAGILDEASLEDYVRQILPSTKYQVPSAK